MEKRTARIGIGTAVSLLFFAGILSAAVAPICPNAQSNVCIFTGVNLEPIKAAPPGLALTANQFRCPVNAPVTGPFLGQYTNLNGETRKRQGVEIRLPEGTDVHAAAGGQVIISKTDLLGPGRFVTIRHASNPNVETTYGYLQPGSGIKEEGTRVNAGDVIGKSGKSETNEFPSLYFELRRGGLAQRDVETICKNKEAPRIVLTEPGPCRFVSPIAGQYKNLIRSPVGQQRETHVHQGDDLTAASGSVASAACSGKVLLSGVKDPGGYGGEITIQCDCKINGKNTYTRYAHMRQRDVKTGERVTVGQRVGLTGGNRNDPDPGSSTGEHLHFELLTGWEYGPYLVPKNYIA